MIDEMTDAWRGMTWPYRVAGLAMFAICAVSVISSFNFW